MEIKPQAMAIPGVPANASVSWLHNHRENYSR
jgi:hypothetical protein